MEFIKTGTLEARKVTDQTLKAVKEAMHLIDIS